MRMSKVQNYKWDSNVNYKSSKEGDSKVRRTLAVLFTREIINATWGWVVDARARARARRWG